MLCLQVWHQPPAVGTVAACGFGAVLWAVVHSGAVHDMLASVLQHALSLGL